MAPSAYLMPYPLTQNMLFIILTSPGSLAGPVFSLFFGWWAKPSVDTSALWATTQFHVSASRGALQSLFENETTDIEPGDTPQWFWEGTRTNPCPITLRDFLTYLIVPETATLLITQDLGISNAEANKIQIQSKEYGNAFYSAIDNRRIDDIMNTNIQVLVHRPILLIFPF